MKHIIIGTAGHIDHGKTTLIKALTGIDTDRLSEEKKRGISIELGFAEFKLPSGQIAGVVDVPGHERFVKNMLAGATGIDIVLLVVAADDGVMPQTREHLAICDLLGVKKGVVALTKADLVDEEWLEMVEEDVREVLEDTSLKGAPIIAVSPVKDRGTKELLDLIDEAAQEVNEKEVDLPYRLPIDRVFSLKGVGAVVTGTLWEGEIPSDAQVSILPKNISARVRTVQVHSRSVDRALAGQRVALNLGGVKASELERGDVILPPDYLSASYMFDAKLYLIPEAPRPLKNRTRIRLHHGTQEVLGRVVLLEGEELAPGKSDYVQFRLEIPIVPKYKDKFIIRAYSPVFTIGGGEVLDSHPHKHKRHRVDVIESMKIREQGEIPDIVELILKEEKAPLTAPDIVTHLELLQDEVKTALDGLTKAGKVEILQGDGERLYLINQVFIQIKEEILHFLEDYLKQNPLSRGAKKELVRTQVLSSLSPKVADIMFGRLIKAGLVVQESDILKLQSAEAGLSDAQKQLTTRLMQLLENNKFRPPTLKEIMAKLKLKQDQLQELLKILIEEGKIERVRFDLYFSGTAVEEARNKIIAFLKENEKITAAEFRDLIGTSRKFAVPILEYLDLKKVTKRIDDYRVLA